MNDIKLKEAGIPEAWWPDCHITKDEQIFTPSFDREGTMTATGREAYDAWVAGQNQPEAPEPTLEQRTAALEGAMLAMMGGDGNV